MLPEIDACCIFVARGGRMMSPIAIVANRAATWTEEIPEGA